MIALPWDDFTFPPFNKRAKLNKLKLESIMSFYTIFLAQNYFNPVCRSCRLIKALAKFTVCKNQTCGNNLLLISRLSQTITKLSNYR